MPPPAEGFAARLVIGPALRTQPDRRLVRLVRDGYESAFEEIVRRYGKTLTRYAGAIVGGRAEDVTQDAFSKALLALRRDDAEIDLRPWLFRIVRNTALNDLRDSPPAPEALAETILGGGRSAAEEAERREELADLIERLRALPEPQRAAIVMRELEGLSHEEIAAALGLSDGGARQAIYRARQALRDGAGMLLPLPLLKALIDNGEAAAGAVGAGVGGAGAAGLGGAAGTSAALKAATATVLVAGAVGAGVTIHAREQSDGPAAKAATVHRSATDRAGEALAAGASDQAEPNRSSEFSRHDGREPNPGGRGSGHGPPDPHSRGDGGAQHHGSRHGPEGEDAGGHGNRGEEGPGHHPSAGSSPSGREQAEDLQENGGDGEGSGSGGGSGEDGGSSSSGDGGSGEDSGSNDGSGSNSGPGTGGGFSESGDDSENSSDSGHGTGLSVQTQPQTQEEP